MTTTELITKLQQVDPQGDMEVWLTDWDLDMVALRGVKVVEDCRHKTFVVLSDDHE